MLRKICDEYFESNVAPILHHLQEIQRQQDARLRALQDEMSRKADAGTVLELASKIEDIVGADSKHTPLQKFEELAAAVERKAEVVPTHALIRTASTEFRAELQELRAEVTEKLQTQSEDEKTMGRVLDNEVRRLDQQVQQIREDLLMAGESWPGRRLCNSFLGSEVGSDVASVTESMADSVTSYGLGPEEKWLLPAHGSCARTRLAARRQRRQERLARQGKSSLATHPECETTSNPSISQAAMMSVGGIV